MTVNKSHKWWALVGVIFAVSLSLLPGYVKAMDEFDEFEEFYFPQRRMTMIDWLDSFIHIHIHLQDYEIEVNNYNNFEIIKPYGYLVNESRPLADFIDIGTSNPYTEEELSEIIDNVSEYASEPEYLIGDLGNAMRNHRYTLEYNIVNAFYRGSSQTELRFLTTFSPSLVLFEETDTEIINYYVIKDDLMTEELTIVGLNNPSIIDQSATALTFTQTTPKSYEAITVTPEEVTDSLANPETLNDLFAKLGAFHSHHIEVL